MADEKCTPEAPPVKQPANWLQRALSQTIFGDAAEQMRARPSRIDAAVDAAVSGNDPCDELNAIKANAGGSPLPRRTNQAQNNRDAERPGQAP